MGKKKSKNSTGSKIDKRRLIEFAIESIVSGPKGIYYAIEEILYNASDAGASTILIKYEDNPDGTINIIFMDDGHGFRGKDMRSGMGYFDSSKMRSDDTTSGVNGTGMKHLLGLGDFAKTRVCIESISDENPNALVKGSFDMDYLVGFGETHFPDEYITSSGLPKQIYWQKPGLKRTTGSNIILKNASKEKVFSPQKLINNLAKYLTPKIAKKVVVYNKLEWHGLKPMKFGVPVFAKSYTRKSVGSVESALFVDPKYNRGNIQICGPENRIMPLNKLLSVYSSIPDELNVLASCGGYIYVQNGNKWRLHNNTMKEDFFKSGGAKAMKEILLQLSKQIAPMLKVVDEKEDDAYKEFIREDVLETILKNNQITYGDNEEFSSKDGIGADVKKRKQSYKSSGISIRPTKIVLRHNQVEEYTLTNAGPTYIDLDLMDWDYRNSPVNVEYDPGKGSSALVTSSNKDEEGFIRLTHPKGKWKIPVIVSEMPKKWISGPNRIDAGRTYQFFIKELIGDVEVKWVIDDPKFAKLSQDGFSTMMKCEKLVMKNSRTVILKAMSHDYKHTFAEKKLTYYPVDERGGAKVMSFGDFNFEIQSVPQGINSAMAQVGADWQTSTNNIPIIGINFASKFYEQIENRAHSLVKSMKFGNTEDRERKKEMQLKKTLYRDLIIAIASAAMGYVIEKKQVDRNTALKLYEDFIAKMKF